MKAKQVGNGERRSWVLAFEPGDEVLACLQRFAADEDLTGAHFTAIGGFCEVVLGFFELDRKDYKRIPVREQVEVLSLSGTVATSEQGAKVHAHAVLGLSDGSTRGGHLLEARVRPTLEAVLTEEQNALVRRRDPATGLPLLDLDAGGPLH